MSSLIVRGGTVVTDTHSWSADVAIEDGRIAAVGRSLEVAPETPTIDAADLLVLPGCIDVHTHMRLPTAKEPDRFFTDSVAAAHGGTTTVIAFNDPDTGISPAGERSLLAGLSEFMERTEGESAIDYGLSSVISGRQSDPLAELPELVARGVPTAKAFMVYDFRLDDERLFSALQAMGRLNGMLQVHCENSTITDRLVSTALAQGRNDSRQHHKCHPKYSEAEATHRAIALARAAEAPIYIVHVSCADALAEVAAAKAEGWPAYGETSPHYLTCTDARYRSDDESEVVRFLTTPPLRSDADRLALAEGVVDGTLDVVATDHVPTRLAIEKRMPAPSFPLIPSGIPGIETLLSVVYSLEVAAGQMSVTRMVDVLATTPARLFGLSTKGALEVGRDADLVLFDPRASRTITQDGLHHSSDFTPYEGMTVHGAVRSVFLRGEAVVRDGQFIGRRGGGRFIQRSIEQVVPGSGEPT